MKKLFKFYWDCGRMGEVSGLFVSTDEAVADAVGKEVYLGEALGKHSEICGELEAKNVTVLSDDQDFVKKFEEIVGSTGYNPLDYISEDDEEDEDEGGEDSE